TSDSVGRDPSRWLVRHVSRGPNPAVSSNDHEEASTVARDEHAGELEITWIGHAGAGRHLDDSLAAGDAGQHGDGLIGREIEAATDEAADRVTQAVGIGEHPRIA